MVIWFLLSISIGVCIVIQGVLNKQFALAYGLATAALINAMVFAVLAFCLFLITQKWPLSFADFLPPKLSQYDWYFWHLVPGICGFLIVTLTPWAIRQLGAAQVYTLVISAQLVFSFVWDHWTAGFTFSTIRLLGLVLVAVGASLFTLAK
jgi:transporter family-2 protein